MNWGIVVDERNKPHPVEINEDGTVTLWQYNLWGSVGNRGYPVHLPRPPQNDKERKLIEGKREMLRKNLKTQEALKASIR